MKPNNSNVSLQNIDEDVVYAKAVAAYARYCNKNGYLYQQPSKCGSYVEEVRGKLFIGLKNINGLLASYRILPEGRIRQAL